MKWKIFNLESLCHIVIGATPSRRNPAYWGGRNVWVTIRELNGSTIYDSREHITDLGVSESPSKLVPSGTLLFSFKLSIGKMAIAGCDLYTNEAIAALPVRSGIKLNRDFLKYALQYVNVNNGADVSVKGSLLNKQKIAAIKVPLPASSEQHRIVEILDQADALRRMRTEADAKVEHILPALFVKMFGEPFTWTEPNTKPLRSLVNIQSGGTPSKKNPDYWVGDVPWVSPKDMKQDIIFDSIDHISQKAIEETNIKYVEPGAILIVVRGMILAHTIPIALAATQLTINQDMKALYPICNDIDSTYLHAALKASSRKILSQVGTAGHGTRKFDTDELLKLPILIPSQEKLKKFQIAATDCRASLAGISKRKEKLEKLFDVLLYRAFSGELTAKWREAHMKELLAEMEEQAKALNLRDNAVSQQLSLL